MGALSGSELRWDALAGEWVAVSGARQTRPNLPRDDCPFCVGGLEAPKPYVVKAFPNRWPMFSPGDPVELDGSRVPGRGAAEVVLYSPEHDASLASLGAEGIRRVIDVWAERTEALLARSEIEYVLVFENRGAEAGATIPHPHGQIYAFPLVPPVPAREAAAARDGCPLCRQVAEERAGRSRVVHEGSGWLAYVPFASPWPYGLLVVPEKHVPGLPELDDVARDGLAAALADVLGRYDRLFSRPFPYMLWVHHGDHLHVHLAPPLRSGETMRYVAAGEVGSGLMTNPVEPEAAAEALRGA
ncbi:MAG: UDPglucose--hexose-phosphate uridylyltransferase [Gaiellaceae bacterium]|nr:UDPglucose--hexose-phosphate uridylyltransferase [Gaiellaceae bacterium]